MITQDTIAFVTGANRGIGKATVHALLDAGAKKVYAGARSTASLDELVSAFAGRVIPVQIDITDRASVAAAAEKAKDTNLLINNAGVFGGTSQLEGSIDDIRNDFEVNYFGTINATRAFAPIIESNGGGTIANLNSVVSLVSMPALGGYSASKAAAHSLTLGLRGELAPKGIHVLGVYPGPVDTDMAANIPMDKATPESVAQRIVDGINAKADSVYPDPFAEQLGKAWNADPSATQNQYALAGNEANA